VISQSFLDRFFNESVEWVVQCGQQSQTNANTLKNFIIIYKDFSFVIYVRFYTIHTVF